MKNNILIELFSDMPSNNYSDSKSAGDLIMIDVIDGIKLIDVLIDNQIEFGVYEVGKCIMDKSYKYWEDISDCIFPKNREDIENENN